MASAAQAALDSFTQLLAGQTAELNAREERIRREREELEEERRMMNTIEARDTDVIHLNVGGKPFATTRRTLCIEPDTMLARLFSGRWEDRIVRDDQNRVFLDYDPALFAILLNYLRSKDIAPPGTKVSLPPPSQIPPLQQQTYKLVLNYLGFSKLSTEFTFAPVANFTVTDENKKAVCNTGSWVHIKTEQTCEPGVSVWRVKAVGPGTHLLLGIVQQNSTAPPALHGTDGYLFYSANTTGYAKASGVDIPTGQPFTAGHIVALSLSATGVLTLKNETTGVTHTLPTTVQMTDTYKFVFQTCGTNNTVEILEQQ